MKPTRHESSPHPQRKPAAQPSASRGIRLPLLVGTAVALVVLLPGLYVWRNYQVKQGAEAFSARAEELAKEGAWSKSAEYWFLYLRLRPDDVEARIQLAETYGHLTNDRSRLDRAVELYYQALAAAPAEQQSELRLRLAELLVQARDFTRAEKEAQTLVNANKADPKAQRCLAMAKFGRSQSASDSTLISTGADVGASLELANRLNPADVEMALVLADIYRNRPPLRSDPARAMSDEQRAAKADELVDALVDADPKQALAYLARYQYRVEHDLGGTESDLEKAAELDPTNVLVLLTAGQHYLRGVIANEVEGAARNELLTKAQNYFDRAITASKTTEMAYLGLGETHRLRGDSQAALETWKLGLKECGETSIVLNLRVAEACLANDDLAEAARRVDTVKTTAQNLRQRGVPPSELGFTLMADVLEAHIAMAKGETDAAVEMLRKIAGNPLGSRGQPPPSYTALMTLAGIHAARGDHELAMKTYDDAAILQPRSAEPRVAAAAMWMNIDRPQLAEQQLLKAESAEDSADNRTLVAAAALRNQLDSPPSQQDWTGVETLLSRARESLDENSQPWRLAMLEAEFQFRRAESGGDAAAGSAAAIATLQRNAEAFASSGEGIANLAILNERFGATDAADRALELAKSKFADLPSTYTASAVILATRKKLDEALHVLDAGMANVSAEYQRPLLTAKASLLAQQGQDNQAWQTMSEAQAARPQDRGLLVQTLELALEQNRFDQAEALEQSLSKLPNVGDNDWKFFRAWRLLGESKDASDAKLAEAESIASEICRQLPSFARGQMLLGDVFDKQGKPEKAVDAYSRAIQLGEQRLMAFERLIMLLFQLGRFSEAETYLERLASRSAASPRLSTLEISLAVKSGARDRAIEAAKLGVARRPQDPLAQIWLAQLLIAAEQPKEAEQALRKAIELGPTDPRTYGAAVNYFVRTKQLDRARAAVEQCARKIDATPAQRELILAAGYEAIGDHQVALSHFEAAVQAEPENANIQEEMGLVMMASDPQVAEKALRRALELNPASDRARRLLADLLVRRGGEDRWQEAQRLAASSTSRDATTDDQRFQAHLLLRRGGPENLARAQRHLEDVLRKPQGEADRGSRLLLAFVHDAKGDHAAAGKQYLSLVNHDAPRAEDLAAYADFLLRTNEIEEAGKRIEQLEQVEPNRLGTVGYRVRWLRAKNQDEEIRPLLESTAAALLKPTLPDKPVGKEQKLQTCLTVGDLYFSARQFDGAERWHRRAYELDPQQYMRLVRSMVELGRIDEAVTLCLNASTTDKSAKPAIAAAGMLLRSSKPMEANGKAEELIARGLEDHPGDTDLLSTVAALRAVQHRGDESIALFRKLVELQPDNVEALNNLATMLAETSDQLPEALERIDQAIKLAGSQPGLLDTKGTILVALGRAKEGIGLLAAAAAAPNGDPRYHLHLAAGYLRAGEIQRAKESLATAKQRELDRQILTESDMRLLAELDERVK